MPKNKKFKGGAAPSIGSFSKNLLGLKFMQRAKQEVEKVAEEKDESFNTSACVTMKTKHQFVMCPSYQFCERLRFGRLSFKGMNADIEALMSKNDPNKEPHSQSTKRAAPMSDTSSDNEIDSLNTSEDDNDETLEDNSILG